MEPVTDFTVETVGHPTTPDCKDGKENEIRPQRRDVAGSSRQAEAPRQPTLRSNFQKILTGRASPTKIRRFRTENLLQLLLPLNATDPIY